MAIPLEVRQRMVTFMQTMWVPDATSDACDRIRGLSAVTPDPAGVGAAELNEEMRRLRIDVMAAIYQPDGWKSRLKGE
jgi:hypothetical protein